MQTNNNERVRCPCTRMYLRIVLSIYYYNVFAYFFSARLSKPKPRVDVFFLPDFNECPAAPFRPRATALLGTYFASEFRVHTHTHTRARNYLCLPNIAVAAQVKRNRYMCIGITIVTCTCSAYTYCTWNHRTGLGNIS